VTRPLEVFSTGTTSVQLVWRLPRGGIHQLRVGAHQRSIDTESNTTAAVDRSRPGLAIGAVTFEDLLPATTYELSLDGRRSGQATTLPRPRGELLARVAAVSDLHLGERRFGHLPRLTSRFEIDDSHPVWCLRGALEEIVAWRPDLLVVKGDLGHRNEPWEYDLASELLVGSGLPLAVMLGNHDGGNHHLLADTPAALAERGLRPIESVEPFDVGPSGDGRVVLVDTRVIGHHGGAVGHHSAATAAAVAEVLPRPSLVVLHHQIQRTTVPLYLPTGISRRDGVPLLDAVAAASPRSLVTSGHTHRHRSWRRHGLRYTEVGATKDFPGVWAAYELYEGGIVQIVRRIAAPRALGWTEWSRRTALGAWGHWSPGRLGDRSITTGA
jgi:Icc protein